MKKLLVIAGCLIMACSMMAQNSDAEISQKIAKTDVENFINECTYSQTDIVESYKTKSCEIEALVITDLKTQKKMGGVHIVTRSSVALQLLTMGAAGADSYDLGYLDVTEIDDVVKVLQDILAMSKAKHPFEYVVDYVSKAGLYIHFDNNNEIFIRRKWNYTNSYGVQSYTILGTDDINMSEVSKLIKKLTDAKEKINAQTK